MEALFCRRRSLFWDGLLLSLDESLLLSHGLLSHGLGCCCRLLLFLGLLSLGSFNLSSSGCRSSRCRGAKTTDPSGLLGVSLCDELIEFCDLSQQLRLSADLLLHFWQQVLESLSLLLHLGLELIDFLQLLHVVLPLLDARLLLLLGLLLLQLESGLDGRLGRCLSRSRLFCFASGHHLRIFTLLWLSLLFDLSLLCLLFHVFFLGGYQLLLGDGLLLDGSLHGRLLSGDLLLDGGLLLLRLLCLCQPIELRDGRKQLIFTLQLVLLLVREFAVAHLLGVELRLKGVDLLELLLAELVLLLLG
mmetsp:Transcript_26991/g.43290  ORF Transcript_26991/g.43290 Transcript_26991/m.43290 type:complete len:303 (-) Transcript_26991:944-1852(-)